MSNVNHLSERVILNWPPHRSLQSHGGNGCWRKTWPKTTLDLTKSTFFFFTLPWTSQGHCRSIALLVCSSVVRFWSTEPTQYLVCCSQTIAPPSFHNSCDQGHQQQPGNGKMWRLGHQSPSVKPWGCHFPAWRLNSELCIGFCSVWSCILGMREVRCRWQERHHIKHCHSPEH